MSRLSLDDVEWGEFWLEELVTIDSGVRLTKSDQVPGDTPFIGSTDSNNGVTSFVSNRNSSTDSNVLGVNYNGSVVESFYHPYMCLFSDDVKRIHWKEHNKGNEFTYLFLKTMILQQKVKYAYGYKFNAKRMQRQKILLPIDKENSPNYQFMEDYIKQEQKVISQKLIDYYEFKMMQTAFDLVGLEDLEWKTFKINEVFDVKSVKGKTISNYDMGKMPYVTTSGQNNGVNSFVDSSDHTSSEKAISIDPIAGKAFFHDYRFIGRGGAGSAINLLYNRHLNKYSGLFICVMIEKVSQEKASYGVALNGDRLKNTKLILPIDEDGNPHWEYMSQFMKNIEATNINKVLEYMYISGSVGTRDGDFAG